MSKIIDIDGNEVDALAWCDKCKKRVALKTKMDFMCPYCKKILRTNRTLDYFIQNL